MTGESVFVYTCSVKKTTLSPQRPVTITDIARRCSVSIGTVSKALHGSAEIGEARAEEIRTMAQALGYDPTAYPEARRLVARRSGRKILNHQLAACFPAYFTHAAYHTAIFSGIIDVVTQTDFGLLTLIDADATPAKEKAHRFPSSLRRGEVDGIIVYGKEYSSHPMLNALTCLPACRHLMKVSLLAPERGCAAVLVDDVDGMRQAAAHLFSLGHRHLLYVRHNMTSTAATRRENGLQRAYNDYGLDPATHLQIFQHQLISLTLPTHYLEPSPSPPTAVEAHPLVQYLRAHPEITAIVAHNDPVAIRLWYLLEEAGWRIPEDISLVGCDDTDPIRDARGQNLLTTVRLPLHDLGQEAARLLIRLVTEEAVANEPLLLPTELIIRGTTAPPSRFR